MQHLIKVVLENEAGALSRVVELFSKRGYNIDSLSVSPQIDSDLSVLNIATSGANSVIEQIIKQLENIKYINTKNLSKISFLDLNDCNTWSSNFQKCCDFIDGHDSPSARNQSLPEPDELLQDSKNLLNWVNEIAKKQKS